MSRNSNKLDQFVPLLIGTLDCPAWRAMSHGARSLYVSLKRRVPRRRNEAFLSYRSAVAELGSSRRMIARWFSELEHYGFVVKAKHGSLGLDGKGKSPHWRLTELGRTSKASASGLFESATNDFLRWDGARFKPKKQNPSSQGSPHQFPRVATSVSHGSPPKPESGSYGVAICKEPTVSDGVAITSIPLPASNSAPSKPSRKTTKESAAHPSRQRVQ